jgi:hypothetical protein
LARNGLLVSVLVFEAVYLVLTHVAGPRIPVIGESVEASVGVANGALIPQAVIGFPLWAPLVTLWAGRRIRPAEAERRR